MMKLGDWVQKSRPSSNVMVKGQGHSSGTKNMLNAAKTPQVRTHGMRSLQTECSSSGRAHFVAARCHS